MVKNFLTLMLCGLILFCFVACDKTKTANNPDNKTANNEVINNQVTTDSTDKTENSTIQTGSVFATENITRITFYGYYGSGKGSEVPDEHMAEITAWLGSFTFDKKVDDALDGINNHVVEIEYADGTVIKEGLDLVDVDGVPYYIKGDKRPDCFEDIISKSTLIISDIKEDKLGESVFKTENIKRITFYGYYGSGKGSDVPSENMPEIIAWLKTFTIDKKADEIPLPGTNTYQVEIEYMDGTVIKSGLDTITIEETGYYLKHGMIPDCFAEIISKTSLN